MHYAGKYALKMSTPYGNFEFWFICEQLLEFKKKIGPGASFKNHNFEFFVSEASFFN